MTGAITVAPCAQPGKGNCINYDTHPSYQIQLLAVDMTGEGQTGIATINIFVINENDDPPTFSQNEYVGTITEGNTLLDPPPIIINVCISVSFHYKLA